MTRHATASIDFADLLRRWERNEPEDVTYVWQFVDYLIELASLRNQTSTIPDIIRAEATCGLCKQTTDNFVYYFTSDNVKVATCRSCVLDGERELRKQRDEARAFLLRRVEASRLDEANRRIALYEKYILAECERYYPDGLPQPPTNYWKHCHGVVGVWDGDNGPKARKPCELCALWNAIAAVIGKSAGDNLDTHQIGEWRCSGCGELNDEIADPAWRWNGAAWEHRCASLHPQAGHMEARRVGGE